MDDRAGAHLHVRRERERDGIERGEGTGLQPPQPDDLDHGAERRALSHRLRRGGAGGADASGGSVYLNSSLGVSRETKNGQPVSYTRTPRGTLISQRNADGTQYSSLFDGLGSVVGMVAVVGTVVARYGYDPYGQLVEKTGPAADGNPWRYTAGYWDAGVGLYKLGARYYDPARGRFTQVDPLGGGYVYASDDPINRIDPSGLDDCPEEECGGDVDPEPPEPTEPPGPPRADCRKIVRMRCLGDESI